MNETDTRPETKVSKLYSVSFRLPVLFVLSVTIIVVIFVSILFYRFRTRMIEEYSHIAEGATNLMAVELDGDKVDDYIDKNFEMEEYVEIRQRFYNIRDSYPDILYLYVYRLAPDGGTVIFDLDSVDGTEDAGEPGEHYEFEDTFMQYIDDFCAGKDVGGITGETEDGYMLTYCKPVYDSKGKLQCHACVDFSMDELHEADLRFIYSIIAVTGASTVVIMLFVIIRLRKYVTEPLNKMFRATEKFAFETQEDHENNIRIMKDLDINTKNEIEQVYREFVFVMEQSLQFMTNLSQARTDIKQRDEQIGMISEQAYRDPLTGVGSKAAYAKKAAEINNAGSDIEDFAIAMIDMNDLKMINDRFGHKAGDNYIKNCCKLICDAFKHSPVYRIGGDEFVVILTGRDFEERSRCISELRAAFDERYDNEALDPWERCSAAIGIADHSSDDSSLEFVFKRADKAMYKDKKDFKDKHGSYR